MNLFLDADLPYEWRLPVDEAFKQDDIQKEDLEIANKLAFVLYNVLTPKVIEIESETFPIIDVVTGM